MISVLNGKLIVNTRAAHQAEALDDMLCSRGAVPLAYPCIQIVPPEDTADLDNTLRDLTTGLYDWLVLTSANTVAALAARLDQLNVSLKDWNAFRTAAIGPTTAAVAKQLLHLENIDDLPTGYDAETLADSIRLTSGNRVLLPESNIARPILADRLTRRGAQVTTVTAYQTICGSGGMDLPRLLAHKQIDAITFTSSSTVTYFLERLHQEGGKREDALGLYAACIGFKTAETARDSGFADVSVSAEHTLDGLVNALEIHFAHAPQVGNNS